MKKIFALALAALLLAGALPLGMAAASDEPKDLPYITADDYMYLNFGSGADANAGNSPEAAKKSFGAAKSAGAIGCLPNGGALIISGKAYLSKSYVMP
ncbi:MAG: hypothetical protein IIX18_02745, partial [Clostridia bacterium]|nr:hypothetical protein [Clostridia bacterium]